MNQINLIGRITKDLELRYTPQNNKAVCDFNIAVNRTYTNENGEREADFINIQAWGKQAENLKKYQSKGSLIGVSGELRVNQWEDEGQRKYKTFVLANQIEFLSSKSSENDTGIDTNNFPNVDELPKSDPFEEMGKKVTFEDYVSVTDDDLPF